METSVVPLAGHGLRPPALRRRASRPQLKRNPLGSRAMPATLIVLLFLPLALLAQQAPPRFMYIHRDSLKRGVDSAYRVIEDEGAQICADLQCPNPYLAIESLNGPHEAWWLNAFASEADTTRVVNAYAANRLLT